MVDFFPYPESVRFRNRFADEPLLSARPSA
jgi:hypothetical protein